MKRSLMISLLALLPAALFAQAANPAPKHKIIKEWSLSDDFTTEEEIPFDTTFSLCNHYRLADKYSPLNSTLGNYGLPFYQFNFFDRVTDPDKYLYSYLYPIMFVPGRNMFMTTQVPFTELDWSVGGPRETAEQTFRIRHSQNVNRFLNFGFIYDIIYSLGEYNYQRAEDKNFTFYTSYTATKYKLYFSAGINNITNWENGGINSVEDLKLFTGRDIEVNLGELNSSKSILKNRNIMLVQKYTIGGTSAPADSGAVRKKGFFGLSGTFTHAFVWETNKRSYSDNDPTTGFYTNIYADSTATFDSLYSRNLKNTVRFDFTTDETRKFRLGGGAGIRNELWRFSQIVPTHGTPASAVSTSYRTSNVLVGKLFNDVGDKFMWMADGELYLTGYRAGDFTVKGKISKSFQFKKGLATWNITGDILNRQPSYWYSRWGSNNFEWSTTLNKEFRIDVGTSFSYPARKTDLRFNYAIIDNYTDFNTMALSSQHSGGLSVAAVYAAKEFRLWKFHLATNLLLQQSSNTDVLDLPLATVRSSFFFEHLFRFKSTNGKLNTQIGAEVLYYTPYYPYAWMPATGRFYRQTHEQTGDYPYLNAFLNLKLQRTRFFIMYDHVNSGFMGYNYFMIPSYPQNTRMLRYGIAWTFYN